MGVRRGTWRKIIRTQGRRELQNVLFAPAVGPQESKEQLRKHWICWETYCLHLFYTIPTYRFCLFRGYNPRFVFITPCLFFTEMSLISPILGGGLL